MSKPITWTESEMQQFKRMVDALSSAVPMTRISAKINMSAFEKEHSKAKCAAMLADLNDKLK